MTWRAALSRLLWFLRRPWLILAAVGAVLLSIAGRRRDRNAGTLSPAKQAHDAMLDAAGARLQAEEAKADAELAEKRAGDPDARARAALDRARARRFSDKD